MLLFLSLIQHEPACSFRTRSSRPAPASGCRSATSTPPCPVGAALIILPDGWRPLRRAEGSVAETLLIVFVLFVVLGMPIGIALGVGALAAATLYPALNPIIIPTRFVGLLSDSYLLLSRAALHPRRQYRRAGRRGARHHRPRHRARGPVPRRPRLRQHRRQHDLRRHLGLGGGRRLGARAPSSSPRWCARATTRTSPPSLTICTAIMAPDHPALDHRGHLRVDGRRIGGGHLRRRLPAGAAGRDRHGRADLHHRPQAQLSEGAAADRAPVHGGPAQRAARAS